MFIVFVPLVLLYLDLISVFLIAPFGNVYITKFLVSYILYTHTQTVLLLLLYIQAKKRK